MAQVPSLANQNDISSDNEPAKKKQKVKTTAAPTPTPILSGPHSKQFGCRDCAEKFSSTSMRDNHRRKAHAVVTKISMMIGEQNGIANVLNSNFSGRVEVQKEDNKRQLEMYAWTMTQ